MTKLWCKLWGFVLRLFEAAVEAIAWAVKTVGTVLVDLITVIAESAADLVSGLLGSPGGLILLGVGAYFLFSAMGNSSAPPDEEERRVPSSDLEVINV